VFERMAPPLLPTTRLSQCPACDEHVKRAEEVCPHCGAPLADTRASGAAAMILMGLALAGCPDKEPDTTTMGETEGMSTTEEASTDASEATSVAESDYGVGVTEGLTEATGGTTTAPTEATTGETGTTGPDTTSATTTGAESDYGVAAL
jgi:hypothetical protein